MIFLMNLHFLFKTTFYALFFALALGGALSAQEQAQTEQPKVFKGLLRAADATTLMAGTRPITIWGLESISSGNPTFKLKARTTIENALDGKPAECEIKGQVQNKLMAQCVTHKDIDLGLMMLQQGYATADRTIIYGTVFEGPYIEAEAQAQQKSMGIWAEAGHEKDSSTGSDGSFMLSLGFILFLCVIAAFTVLTVIIMRGFQKVINAQNDNMHMMSQERRLRDKERGIVAFMLESELKGNKSKVEAFLVVYEEMLKSLMDQERTPRYKRAGDIVQKQPALDRSVFDRNTDKLDILGRRLSSELIHFYARIKTAPEYINLEPSTDIKDAVKLLEGVVKNAQRLNQLADQLLDSFSSSGVTSARPLDEIGDGVEPIESDEQPKANSKKAGAKA